MYGSPGEVDDAGNVHMINAVPKSHSPLFQAFSQSEGTIRWAFREGLIPTLLTANPEQLRKFAEIHVEEAALHGRQLALGENLGVFRNVYIADDRAQARDLAMRGLMGTGWQGWCHDFGFTKAARLPEDDLKPPASCRHRRRSPWSASRRRTWLLSATPTTSVGKWTCWSRPATRSGSSGTLTRATCRWTT